MPAFVTSAVPLPCCSSLAIQHANFAAIRPTPRSSRPNIAQWRAAASVPPPPPAQQEPPPSPPSSAAAASPLEYISLGNNAFALRHADTTLLVDPWLVGDLVFATPRFYRAKKTRAPASRNPSRFPLSQVAAVVLTQALPDHAHPPTLEILPRHLPFVVPPDAVPLLRALGFRDVEALDFGKSVAPLPSRPDIVLTAARGAQVGPPWSRPQNAYLITFASKKARISLYHEPHGAHDARFLRSLAADGAPRLDVAVAPVVSSKLPVLANYPLVNGVPEAIEMLRATKPRVCVAFDNSPGEASGFLSKLVEQRGGADAIRDALAAEDDLSDVKLVSELPLMTPVIIAGAEDAAIGSIAEKSQLE